jgi:hypothetical protein
VWRTAVIQRAAILVALVGLASDPENHERGWKMDADFLTKLDKAIENANKKQATGFEIKNALQTRRNEVMAQVKPMLVDCASNLRERKIDVELFDQAGLTFKMKFRNGGFYGFQLEDEAFVVICKNKNDHAVSRPGMYQSIVDGWNVESFKEFLQWCILSFVEEDKGR